MFSRPAIISLTSCTHQYCKMVLCFSRSLKSKLRITITQMLNNAARIRAESSVLPKGEF